MFGRECWVHYFISFSLDIYANVLIVARGLVYEIELSILLWWLEKSDKATSKKLPGVHKSTLPKHVIAQVIVDIIKKQDTPPFTLTPVQIYAGKERIDTLYLI